jgi:hypothetical protein
MSNTSGIRTNLLHCAFSTGYISDDFPRDESLGFGSVLLSGDSDG